MHKFNLNWLSSAAFRCVVGSVTIATGIYGSTKFVHNNVQESKWPENVRILHTTQTSQIQESMKSDCTNISTLRTLNLTNCWWMFGELTTTKCIDTWFKTSYQKDIWKERIKTIDTAQLFQTHWENCHNIHSAQSTNKDHLDLITSDTNNKDKINHWIFQKEQLFELKQKYPQLYDKYINILDFWDDKHRDELTWNHVKNDNQTIYYVSNDVSVDDIVNVISTTTDDSDTDINKPFDVYMESPGIARVLFEVYGQNNLESDDTADPPAYFGSISENDTKTIRKTQKNIAEFCSYIKQAKQRDPRYFDQELPRIYVNLQQPSTDKKVNKPKSVWINDDELIELICEPKRSLDDILAQHVGNGHKKYKSDLKLRENWRDDVIFVDGRKNTRTRCYFELKHSIYTNWYEILDEETQDAFINLVKDKKYVVFYCGHSNTRGPRTAGAYLSVLDKILADDDLKEKYKINPDQTVCILQFGAKGMFLYNHLMNTGICEKQIKVREQICAYREGTDILISSRDHTPTGNKAREIIELCDQRYTKRYESKLSNDNLIDLADLQRTHSQNST